MRLIPRFPFIAFDDKSGPSRPALDRVRNRHLAELLREETKAQKRILRAWRGAEKRILRDLARLLKTIQTAESLGVPLSPSIIHREARYQSFLHTVREELAGLGETTTDATTAAQEAMVNAGLRHAIGRMEAYVPDRSFIRLPKEAVSHLVGNLTDGSPLAELLYDLPGSASSEVQQILIDGLATARNPREIASALRKVSVDTPRQRALLISRTEINRVYRSSLLDCYRANDQVFSGWVWRSARDRRTCPVCLAMDGQRFKWDDPFGSHPACRCSPDPILRYLDDPAEEADTGEAWLRQQPETRQLQALGPTRLKAWREGRPLAEMVQVVPNDRWGPGRRMRTLRDLGLTQIRPIRAPAPVPPHRPSPKPRPKKAVRPKPSPAPSVWTRLSPDASYRAQQLFSAPVTVIASQADRNALKAVLGFDPNDDHLADLVGALGGSRIFVTRKGGSVSVSIGHSLVQTQQRTITRTAAGEVFIHNDALVLIDAARGGGVGPMMFQKQIDACSRSGLNWVETWGARLRGFPDGYRVWPNLGYNQDLPAEVVRKLPKKFSAAVTIQDLLAIPGGRDWWVKRGTDLKHLKFDLSPGSLSHQIMDAVMKKHDVKFSSRKPEDPGARGMRDEDYSLSAEEHSRVVKRWLKENEPEKFRKLFPKD